MITIEKLSVGRGRLLAAGFYSVCVVFLLSPSLDVMGAVVPIRFDNIQWRFGMVISLAPTIMVQAVALGATAVFAVLWGHKGVLRTLAVLSITLAALYAIMTLMFAIDCLQLRGAIPSGRRDAFYVLVGKCLVQSAIGAVTLAVLGMGAWRITRVKVVDTKKEAERAAKAVVTGRA